MPAKAKPQLFLPSHRGGRKQTPGGMLRHKSHRRIPFSSDFVMIFTCQLLSAMAVLIATLLGYDLNADGTSQNSPTHGERHIDLLKQIWNAGNTSLDPCKDFHLYNCYNFRHQQERQASQFNELDAESGVLLGLFRKEAGRLLFVYYGSCFKAQWKPESLGRQAIRAVLSVAYVSPKMSPLQLLAMIVKLNLAYGLHGNIVIFQKEHGRLPYWLHENPISKGLSKVHVRVETLLVFALPTALIADRDWTSAFFGPSFADVTDELLDVGINITSAQITEFAIELNALSGDELFFTTNISALGTLVPGVSTRLWKDMVEAHTARTLGDTLIHSCLRKLKDRFSVLLDRRLQPLSVAAVVTEAAMSLLLEYRELPQTAAELYGFCANEASVLEPVWVLNVLISFAAKTEHNDILLNTLDTLILAIKAQLKDALNAEDVSTFDKTLNNMQLLLPYHVYPLDLPLPSLAADNFFFNVLLVRQWGLTVDRYRPPRGISDAQLQFMRYASLSFNGDYLVVPAGVYGYIMLDRTLSVTPMAIFGFYMADFLWKLLSNLPWTPAGQAAFERLRFPDERVRNASSLQGSLQYPLLALNSCIHGLRLQGYAHWNGEIRHWGQWRFTIKQLFFRTMVLYFYCFYEEEEEAHARHEVSLLIRHTEDFQEAFQCPRD